MTELEKEWRKIIKQEIRNQAPFFISFILGALGGLTFALDISTPVKWVLWVLLYMIGLATYFKTLPPLFPMEL